MAFTTYGNSAAASTSLKDRAVAFLETVRVELAKRRVYRQTLSELSALSERDLNDLGLNRSMLRSVAQEAAYGK